MFKKRIFATLFLVMAAMVPAVPAQRAYEIFRSACLGPSPVVPKPFVIVETDGDINLVPCDGKTVNINGVPIGPGLLSLNALTASAQFLTVAANDTASWSDSVATHQLRLPITAITGSSRTNFFPNFTAANTFGKSPFSWNGTLYNFQNTALNNTFSMQFTPSSTVGLFSVGTGGNVFSIDQSSGNVVLSGDNDISLQSGNTTFELDGSGNTATMAGNGVTVNSRSNSFIAGDIGGVGFGTLLTLDDASSSITLAAASGVLLPDQSPSAVLTLNGGGRISSNLLTNGQILIGSTGADPIAATLTAGTGIAITGGTGSITIASNGTAPLSSVLASDFTNATATFSNTALSVPVAAGGTYAFTLQAFVSDSTAAEGGKIDFAGGSATFTNFIAGSNSVLVTTVTTANTGTFSNATITGNNLITISGTATINAGGTFIVRAAQNTHALGTLTMSRGSRLMLNKL